jgi:hypothetical protein
MNLFGHVGVRKDAEGEWGGALELSRPLSTPESSGEERAVNPFVVSGARVREFVRETFGVRT